MIIIIIVSSFVIYGSASVKAQTQISKLAQNNHYNKTYTNKHTNKQTYNTTKESEIL